jgi:hypothetical protein
MPVARSRTELCVKEAGLQKGAEEATQLSAWRVLAVFLQAHSRTVFELTKLLRYSVPILMFPSPYKFGQSEHVTAQSKN